MTEVAEKIESCDDTKTEEQCDTSAKESEENANTENSTELSEIEKRIVFQMEYYFGDCNLLKDKFLRQYTETDLGGWVPLSLFLKFRRLSLITTDTSLIASTLKKAGSKLVQVSEDGLNVRRNPDLKLPEDVDKWVRDNHPKTVFLSGFPTDGSLNMDNVLDFLYTVCRYEGVIQRHRKSDRRTFKGSMLVLFPTEEDAQNFVKAGDLEFNGLKLVKELQTDHFQRKREMIKEKLQARKESQQKEYAKLMIQLPKGALIHIRGIPEDTRRGALIQFLVNSGLNDYAFIEHEEGKTEAYVRLKEENTAETVLGKLFPEGKLKFKDAELEAKVVTGEEEEAKLLQMIKDRVSAAPRGRKGRKQKQGSRKIKRFCKDENDDKNNDVEEKNDEAVKQEQGSRKIIRFSDDENDDKNNDVEEKNDEAEDD